MIHVFLETKRRAKDDVLERILFETALVRLTTMQDIRPLDEVLERLETIGKKLGQEADVMVREPALRTQDSGHKAQNSSPTTVHPEEVKPEEVKKDGPLADTWNKVMTLVQSRKGSTGSFLQHGAPIKLENSEIVIGFSKKIYKERLEHSEEITLIEQCIEEIFGRKIKAKMVILEGKRADSLHEGNRTQGAPSSPPLLSPSGEEGRVDGLPDTVEAEPMVKKVLELFGGSVVNVRRQGK
jgi:hypothetical protein